LPEYTDYLLRTTPYISEYTCRSTGIRSSRLRLYPEKFLSIPLIQPPPAEQQEILSYIDQEVQGLNQASDRIRREIELIGEYRTRLIADVVTGKLDVRNIAFPDDEAGEEWQSLGEAGEDDLDADPEEMTEDADDEHE
jgi:type I restriction enzyme S subunit